MLPVLFFVPFFVRKQMKAHKIINNSLLIIFFFVGIGYGSQDLIDLKIQGITHRSNDISWVTSDIKSTVIQRLKLIQNSSPDNDIRDNAENGLVALGDDETIARLANQLQSGDFALQSTAENKLRLYGREGIIVYLAPLMFLADKARSEYNGGIDRVETDSLHDRAASMIIRAVGRSTAFPIATTAWAKNLSVGEVGIGADHNHDLVRQWWAHNKNAILSRQYSNATWLPSPSE